MKAADANTRRRRPIFGGQKSLLRLAAAALLVMLLLEATRSRQADPLFAAKLEAAKHMELAMRALREARLERGIPIEPGIDPNHTGLIGWEHTAITTTLGHLPAKRTSTNPNMAGVIVAMLASAGATHGGCVAVGFSGSFPALNTAVLCALRALRLKPVIVSSVGASSYGANDPRFTWIDMERTLHEQRIIPWRSAAVAPGGVVSLPDLFEEGGLEDGLRETQAALARAGLPLLDERGEETLSADVDHRLGLYREGCGGHPAVFVNVGGSLTALGKGPQARTLATGLLPPGRGSQGSDGGVIQRMAAAGVPVIHLLDIHKIARDYGLPVDPVPLPAVPDGRVMVHGGYSPAVALIGLLVLAVLGARIRPQRS